MTTTTIAAARQMRDYESLQVAHKVTIEITTNKTSKLQKQGSKGHSAPPRLCCLRPIRRIGSDPQQQPPATNVATTRCVNAQIIRLANVFKFELKVQSLVS